MWVEALTPARVPAVDEVEAEVKTGWVEDQRAQIRQRAFEGDVALAADIDADFFPWGAASTAVLNLGNGCQNRVVNIMPTGIVEVGP